MRRFVLKQEPVEQPSLSIDYAGELNPQQWAAVTAADGPVLVIAGAGTGKTRTLVYRVAYLVETGVLPERILLLTFTRRAAREMLARASALLDGRCERVQGGTFHAFCLHLLKQYAPVIGFPRTFTMLDASDAADVVNVLRTAKGLHQSKKRFPRKNTLCSIFSKVVNRGLALADLLDAEYPQFLVHLDALAALHTAYADYKRSHGLMDYDDLLHYTLHLFRTDDEVRRRVAAQCRHVLVDEYQDTNRLQADLVEYFSSVHGNVMAVGDDAQSIYRFRGADSGNIFAFPVRYADTRLLKLEQNYRSTQPILDLANFVIARAHEKYDKALFTEREGGEPPAFVQAPDEQFESRFVCQMVLQLREEGVPLNRLAVLFRNGHSSYDLELALNRRRIPFVKYGGLKLSEAAHIKDVLAHLKVVENPKDAVSWNRILLLLEGIGPKTTQDLLDWIAAAQDPLALDRVYTSPRYEEQLRRLSAVLQQLRTTELPVPAQVEAVVRYYEPILDRIHYEDADKRRQDLDRFVPLTENFGTRADLLNALALDPIDLTVLDTEAVQKDEPPLVLSTIHSAKGLEFHAVFLIQALDGIIPSAYTMRDEAALDEELRLLYVALTRAETHLFISYPVLQQRRRYGDYFSKPTRFLDDVPDAVLEPWALVEEARTPPQLGEGHRS